MRESGETKMIEKRDALLLLCEVKKRLDDPFFASLFRRVKSLNRLEEEVAFLSLLAIGQADHLLRGEKSLSMLQKIAKVERFFEPEGGILGYQAKVEACLAKSEQPPLKILSPPCYKAKEKKSVIAGILSLPLMGEICPLGGLGDRLNLKTKAGKLLPAALLPFLGRSLLEGIIRDVSAREFLYYKLFSCQLTTPIALMTSLARENDKFLHLLLLKKRWFSRPPKSFFLFSQVLVPVVTDEGQWTLSEQDEINLQPGGHGALWRMAEERGVFDWFVRAKKEALLIRQINNPIAGLDSTLFTLIGVGREEKKTFGIAACPRLAEGAEGALAWIEKESGKIALTNIEYTDIKRYGIEKDARFPANTNILYADIQRLLPVIQQHPIPEEILNMKGTLAVINKKGIKEERKVGRLESMMQNISDFLEASSPDSLSSFITYNARERTMAATKREYLLGSSLLETPEGVYFELMKENCRLLAQECHFELPAFSTEEEYVKEGPSTLFLYHPSLGPLYEIIQAKIQVGKMEKESELVLELSELLMQRCEIAGSLRIHADNVMGHVEEGLLRYSERTGKAILRNVRIVNCGIDRNKPNHYWKGAIHRKESFQLHLKGMSEFIAEDLTFEGNVKITVPDGMRWIAYRKKDHTIGFHKERIEVPTFFWKYDLEGEKIMARLHLDDAHMRTLLDKQCQRQWRSQQLKK